MQSQSKLIKLESLIGKLKDAGLLTATKGVSPEEHKREISYPETDTRFFSSGLGGVKSFICIRGSAYDGHDFITQAINSGAGLLIVEKEQRFDGIMQLVVSDSRKALATLAALYFADPSSQLFLVGVTGTNGKTSIVKIIETILLKQGLAVGSIGTLGYTINGKLHTLERTTPDITQLNQILAEMVEHRIRYVVMEVSSHSLKLDRVYGLKFDLAIFTNLSREHLDFHPDMEDYFLTKKKLFSYLKENEGIALINTDDRYGKLIHDEYEEEKYSISATAGDITYEINNSDLSRSDFKIEYKNSFYEKYKGKNDPDRNRSFSVSTPLLGEHNVMNITTAVSAVKIINSEISFGDVKSSLPDRIKGRLQKVINSRDIACFIDYAHTPEALESVCKTVRNALSAGKGGQKLMDKKRRFICVMGAGGDRDKGKRKEMTDAVLQYADYLIITSDNPRNEKAADIALDMTEHLHPLAHYWIVLDRREAIDTSILLASPNDVILIAGKGHEAFQDISGKLFPFDDYLAAQKAISKSYESADEAEPYCAYPTTDDSSQGSVYSTATIKLALPLQLIQTKILLENNDDLEDCFSLGRKKDQKKLITNPAPSRLTKLRDRILTEEDTTFSSVSIDTRTIKDQTLYFALKGEIHDGHDYLSEALKYPSNWAIINKDHELPASFEYGSRIIRVKDTRLAFSLMAKKYRSLFPARLIAITGSNGKTTTKEFCFNILSQKKNVLKNWANENNVIGVSKTLYRLSSIHDYAVVEIGSNHPGEIELLSDICEPDIAMLTNIGPAHLEYFTDLKGVFTEKTALLKRDLQFAIIPSDDEFFAVFSGNFIRVGFTSDREKEKNGYKVEILNLSEEKSRFRVCGENYTIATDVKFNIQNAAFAVVLANELGFRRDEIQNGLDLQIALRDRMEIFQSNSRTIISDCYNANPLTMKAAIDYWLSFKKDSPHAAVLGDMNELGESSAEYHEEIGDYLQQRISEFYMKPHIITVGNQAKKYGGNESFKDINELVTSFNFDNIADNAVVLLKASRSMHLEKIKGRL